MPKYLVSASRKTCISESMPVQDSLSETPYLHFSRYLFLVPFFFLFCRGGGEGRGGGGEWGGLINESKDFDKYHINESLYKL